MENKKNLINEEELNKVAGGAAAGNSVNLDDVTIIPLDPNKPFGVVLSGSVNDEDLYNVSGGALAQKDLGTLHTVFEQPVIKNQNGSKSDEPTLYQPTITTPTKPTTPTGNFIPTETL